MTHWLLQQVKSFFLASSWLALSLCAQEPAPNTPSSEEALFVRRILEFWRDKESAIVKAQIKEFITKYPSSEFVDSLLVILGDTNWSERNFREALAAYRKISSKPLQEKVYNNHLDTLYHLKKFDELTELVKTNLPEPEAFTHKPEEHLWMYYYAEAQLQQARENDSPQAAKEQYLAALPYFVKLLHTLYDSKARFSLAEIYLALERFPEASSLYLELADEYPEKQEKLLMQAGQIQMRYDPLKALDTFSRAERLQGELAHEAALQRARILFEEKLYRDLIGQEDAMQATLKEYQLAQWKEYLGRSHFALENYDEALQVLSPLLPACEQRLLENPKNKTILLCLLVSAYYQNELALVETLTNRFEKSFPTDPMLAQVLYMKAMSYLQTDHFAEAQELFARLLEEYPEFDKRELVLFENSRLLSILEQWSDARLGFLLFAQEYTESPKRGLALQHIANATSHMLEKAEKNKEATAGLREILIADLQLVLSSPESMKTFQKPKFLYCLAKTHYELKQYSEALAALKTYLEQFPSDLALYQAHLLAALCYQEGVKDPQNFAFHAERVLALKPDLPDQHQLRLSLFTTYLQLAQKVQEIETALPGSQHHSPYINMAAEHLYAAAASDKAFIKPENLFWLANYYYGKIKEKNDEYVIDSLEEPLLIDYAEKSARLFRKLLSAENGHYTSLHQGNLQLENEFFKWSNLYGWLGNPEQQILILQEILTQQEKNPEWKWNLRNRTKFALANALSATGDLPKALEIYGQLMLNRKGADPYITGAAKLEFARLTFALMPEEDRTLENPQIVSILKNLKDLQIRKNAAHEPLHLEAALEYAKIRASLEPPERQDSQLSFLLQRSKEDFSRTDDIASKDYEESRKKYPAKDAIYQAYMRLIDAHIAYAQALQAREKQDTQEWERLKEEARLLYHSLLEGKYAVSKYVVNEAKACLGKLCN